MPGKTWIKWVLIGVGVLVLVGVVFARPDRKLFEMVKEELIKDQKEIQEGLEKEVERLNQETGKYLSEIERLKGERDVIKKENGRLQGKIMEIEEKLAAVEANIPRDPDRLVDKFRTLGFGSAHKGNRSSPSQ